MPYTPESPRPRAFDPQTKRDTPPPPTPGWDQGPDRRIEDGKMLKSAFAWAGIGVGAAVGAKVVSNMRDSK